MLSYENFKIRIKEEINRLLACSYKDFAGWTIMDNVRYSINRKIEFLELVPPEGFRREQIMLPSFRYMSMYQGYVSGFSVAGIARDVADSMVKNLVTPSYPVTDDPSAMIMDMDHIFISLIGRDLNRELLKTIPHVDFLDLAVIFRSVMPMDDGSEYAALISNAMLSEIGKTTEELLAIACANTMRDYPPVAKKRTENYCLTADAGTICSHVLACDQLLYDTACDAGCNLYIVPTTLRFCVAFPEKSYDQLDLEGASRRTSARLRDEDKLSDGLYYYDRSTHKLSLCSSSQVREENLQEAYRVSA